MEERRLSGPEKDVLRDVLRRHAGDEPLEAITTRLGFGRVVDSAMQQARRRLSDEDFRQLGNRLRDIRIQLGLDSTAPGQQIHTTRDLDGGQGIDVAQSDTNNWIHLHVDDVDEAYLYLRYRDDAPIPAMPGAGENVKCHLWRDDDGRYSFTTTVVQSQPAAGRITLAHTSTLTRTQSREHFRVRHDQSTTLGVVGTATEDATAGLHLRQPVTRLRGRITSLSAGGCAIVVQQSVSKQTLLRLTLDLPDEQPLDVHARVVAAQPISGGRYLLRVEFIELSDDSTDIVSRHVMRKQQQTLAARQNKDSA